MKKLLIILLSVIVLSVVFYLVWLSPRYVVPILMYHNIGYSQSSSFVSPENFTRQMEYLKKNNYQVITLDELVRSIKEKQPLKKNKVVITFDDGYKDNFEYAYPVLKKFRFPAMIFLVTGDIENKSHHLNWDEVMVMYRHGICFGGHAMTHIYLGDIIDKKTAMEQIAGSKQAIEQKTGISVDYFSYPSGGFNEIVKQAVREAGYQAACTTNRGSVRFNRDIYELKRIKVTNSDTNKPFSFWAKLSGYYNLFRDKNNK